MTRSGVAAIVCALSVLPAGASAKAPTTSLPGQPAGEERELAKRLFQQARLAYRRGDYESAILKWQESYELSREPLIFLSIANAYERLTEPAAALENLQRWRKEAPESEHAELDGRIARLAKRVAVRKAEAKAKREAAQQLKEQNRQEQQRRRAESAQRTDEETAVPTTVIAGYTLLGVGAAAVAAGVVMDLVALGNRPSEEEACSNTAGRLLCLDEHQSDISSSNSLAIVGDVFWISGASLAAGGLVTLILGGAFDKGSTDERGSALVVRPLLSGSAGAFTLSGMF